MGKADRVLGSAPSATRKEPWWFAQCQAGRHAWEVTAVIGLFACGRCGVVGTCRHYAGTLRQVEQVTCGAWCRRLQEEGVVP